MAKKQNTAVTTPTGRNLPTNWKERLAVRAKAAVEQVSSISVGAFIGTRAGQLSWQGNTFAENKIEAVALDFMLENAYYPDDFDADSPTPPTCYAFGRDAKTMAPHEKSTKRQAASCSECEHNEFETSKTGRGKACKNIARIALVSAKPLTQDALLKGEVAFLKVPVTSMKAWGAYVRSVSATEGCDPVGVVTAITARPDPKTQFKLSFQNNGRLDDSLMPAAVARGDEIAETIAFPYPEVGEERQSKKPMKAKKRKY